MRRSFLLFLVPLAALGATMCSASPDQGTIEILTVDDPFVGPPAAAEISVHAVAYDDAGSDGAVSLLAEAPLSAGASTTIDLGTYDESNTESLVIAATDKAGTTVAWGESLPVEIDAIAGVSLGVFVQRVGTLSRMPTPLSDGRPAPLLNVVGGRYILVSGGGDSNLTSQTNLYDLVSWAPLGSPPSLPVAPASLALAVVGGDIQALAISSSDAAWYDLTDAVTSDASTSAGNGNWADVAGGMTITSPDQSVSYVVGGTRTTGAPSTTVLVIGSGGALSWVNLEAPRLGATAAWVAPVGLVIEGGNVPSVGDAGTSHGVEYVDGTGSTHFALDYPADTTTGAGMTVLGAAGAAWSTVLIVGGASESEGGTNARTLPIPCGGGSYPACSSTPWETALPTPLVSTQVFDIDSSSVFVVGDDANLSTHAYTLSSATVTEVPFRVPRTQARAVRLPIGTPGTGPVALVGGDPDAGANTGYIESFIPFPAD